MRRFIFASLLLCPAFGFSEGPRFRHKEPALQQEFQNVYKDIRPHNIILSTFTASSTEVCIDSPTFCVDIVENQVVVTTGTAAKPSLAVGTDDTGLFKNSSNLAFSVGGAIQGQFTSDYLQLPTGNWFSAPDGTASDPTYTFTNDDDTGIYLHGTNLVGITGGGTAVCRFGSGLTMSGTGSANPIFALDGSASAPTIAFRDDADSGFYRLGANTLAWVVGGGGGNRTLSLSSSNFEPFGAGSLSTGNSSNYWNDVSYKTLTDRGCLGWFDDGVEMPDGETVSDLEVFSLLKMHPTKTTVYGKPMLDYRTFPKVAYKKASYEKDGGTKYYPRDNQDEPYFWEVKTSSGTEIVYSEKKPKGEATKKLAADGVEMTAMQSIIMGALKEAHARIEALESKVAALESK